MLLLPHYVVGSYSGRIHARIFYCHILLQIMLTERCEVVPAVIAGFMNAQWYM